MRKKVPQLDAVRGLAVLVVVLHNVNETFPSLHLQPIFRDGWMGVDLFFVLSGFLITGILVDTRESKDYFKNFYARRCLRIWPLYFSLIFFMFIIVPFLRPSEAHAIFQKSSPWWAYLLFLQNFLIAVPTSAVGPLGVTWSLAVEEQFYLVWPLVLRYCSLAAVRRCAFAVVCLSPLIRYYLQSHGVVIYSNFFCRLDGLMLGAILALLARSIDFVPAKYTKNAWILLLTATPLALAVEAFNLTWIVFSFSALASFAFVYLALFAPQGWLQRILINRFLVYTGTISYGLYLLHKLPFDAVKAIHLSRYPLLVLPVALLVAYTLAVLSWCLLERQFLALKRFFEPGTPGRSEKELAVVAGG